MNIGGLWWKHNRKVIQLTKHEVYVDKFGHGKLYWWNMVDRLTKYTGN